MARAFRDYLETIATVPHQRRPSDILTELKPEPWTAAALCAQTDPELFFPDHGRSPKPAKKICQACPVLAECRAYVLAHREPFGVWGGLSEKERRQLKGAA